MNWSLTLVATGISFACAGLGIWPLVHYLRHRSILDHPNERSSHVTPTPKGAGLVLIPILAIAWIILGHMSDLLPVRETAGIAALALLLAAISWIDDLRHVSAMIRLAAHFIVAAIAVEMMPDNILFFHGLFPEKTDAVAAVVLLVWFINAFNFMDGIDGISGTTSIAIGLGVIVVATMSSAYLTPFAGALVGTTAAFLIWNWHPAKIFLGDVGSAPLGLLIGWLLLSLDLNGLWAPALILPGYYMADAGITVLKRMFRGKRIWEAHNEHFFQQAALSGLSHARVSGIIFIMNLTLVGGAYVAANGYPIEAIITCVILVLTLLYIFYSRGKITSKNAP